MSNSCEYKSSSFEGYFFFSMVIIIIQRFAGGITLSLCHSLVFWIPVFTGMTNKLSSRGTRGIPLKKPLKSDSYSRKGFLHSGRNDTLSVILTNAGIQFIIYPPAPLEMGFFNFIFPLFLPSLSFHRLYRITTHSSPSSSFASQGATESSATGISRHVLSRGDASSHGRRHIRDEGRDVSPEREQARYASVRYCRFPIGSSSSSLHTLSPEHSVSVPIVSRDHGSSP